MVVVLLFQKKEKKEKEKVVHYKNICYSQCFVLHDACYEKGTDRSRFKSCSTRKAA